MEAGTRIVVLAIGATVGLGCAEPDDEAKPQAFSSGIEPADGAGDAAGDTEGDEAGGGGGGGGGTKLDVAGGQADQGGDEGGEEGCKKVDFVFVIDSSPSMEDEQQNLLTSFPGFITAIQDTLDLDDFHLMVVDAGLAEVPLPGCDGTLGAGQTKSGVGADCGLATDARYATEAQADLTPAFQCMASRGFAGPGNEQTMDALVASIGPLTEPGQCNEGFLRDDAILVVTVITDEEDSPGDAVALPSLDGSCEPVDADPNSTGSPPAWREAVVDAKNGDPTSAVVLALIGDCDAGGTCPGIALDVLNPAAPITGAEPAPRLREFATSFEYGTVGPVCAPDYAPFFEEAVSVIESACEDFVPPA